MSSGKFPDPRVNRAYRRSFIDRWAAFLGATFYSPSHIAVAFGVDESTARSWRDRITSPSGFAVAIAFRDYPDNAARFLTGGWPGRLICWFMGCGYRAVRGLQ